MGTIIFIGVICLVVYGSRSVAEYLMKKDLYDFVINHRRKVKNNVC